MSTHPQYIRTEYCSPWTDLGEILHLEFLQKFVKMYHFKGQITELNT